MLIFNDIIFGIGVLANSEDILFKESRELEEGR